LRQVIAAETATALMACLLRFRFLAMHCAIGGASILLMRRIVSGARRLALMILLALLGLVASLLIHELCLLLCSREASRR
jgi:hypothetical protein